MRQSRVPRDENILVQKMDGVISLVLSAELPSGCWDKSPQGIAHIWCFSLPAVPDTSQVTVAGEINDWMAKRLGFIQFRASLASRV